MSQGNSNCRKLAVIGAGNVGLLFLQTFLKEGHNVTCFEQRSKVGGMWNFETKPEEEKRGYANLNDDGSVTCAFSQIHINASKYAMFQAEILYDEKVEIPDKHWISGNDFLHALTDYAKKYNMMNHIRFNTEVRRLDKVDKGWKVIYKTQNEEVKEELFEFVVCCSGGFRYPKMPNFKNMTSFKGLAIHSSQVRLEKYLYPGKTVYVVGSSYSGTDMVYYALKSGAKKVYWSETRDTGGYNHWMLDRCPLDKDPDKPFDLGYTRSDWFDKPQMFLNYLESLSTPVHKRSPTAPLMLPSDRFGITGVDYLLEQEKLCKLQKIGPLESITETGANLSSGLTISDVDLIIYATGFDTKFPILDHIWDVEEQKKTELYMNMLLADKGLHGLAIAGANDSYVSKVAVYELQAIWLCRVWLSRNYDKEGKLFSDAQMKKMSQSIDHLVKKLPHKYRFNRISNVYGLCDCLAKDLGCLPPNYKELIRKGNRKDVELGISLMKGPLCGMQYRLQGADSFPNAADFFVKLSRRQIGDKEFDELCDLAMKDKDRFFEQQEISSDKYVVQPYFESIME